MQALVNHLHFLCWLLNIEQALHMPLHHGPQSKLNTAENFLWLTVQGCAQRLYLEIYIEIYQFILLIIILIPPTPIFSILSFTCSPFNTEFHFPQLADYMMN